MTWKRRKSLKVLLPICLAFASTVGEIGSQLDEMSAIVEQSSNSDSSYVETFPVSLSSRAQQE